MEKIICAAIHYNDGIERSHLPRNIKSGIVAAGWRHHNCFTILWSLYPTRDYIGADTVQGFLTTEGNFFNREDSYILAEAAGQILEEERIRFPDRRELYSEHLY